MAGGGYSGFSSGMATGFSLLDRYYDRKASRERAARLDDENTRRWNITNERQAMSTDLGNQVKREQLQGYRDERSANTWDSVMNGPDGKPVDFTRLSKDELRTKGSQILQVVNNTPELKAELTKNPDVDPESPLANLSFIYDQKTKQPSAVISLRMKDGTVKPLTENRSGDPNDTVIIVPVSELDAQARALLGNKGALGERKKMAATMATESRKFKRDKELAQIKAGGKPPTVKNVITEGVESTVEWDKENNRWKPFGQDASGEGAIPLDQAMQMARREYDDKASMFESDQSQFGMTENEWINKRAQEIMGGNSSSQTKPAGGGKVSYEDAVIALEARKGSALTEAEKAKVKARYGGTTPTYDDYISRAKQIAKSKGIEWTGDMEQEGRRRFNSKYGGTAKPAEKPKKKPEMALDRQSARKRVVKRNERARNRQRIVVKEIARTDLSALSKSQIKGLIDKLDTSTFGVTGYLDDDVKDQRVRLRKAYKAAGGRSLGRSGG